MLGFTAEDMETDPMHPFPVEEGPMCRTLAHRVVQPLMSRRLEKDPPFRGMR